MVLWRYTWADAAWPVTQWACGSTSSRPASIELEQWPICSISILYYTMLYYTRELYHTLQYYAMLYWRYTAMTRTYKCTCFILNSITWPIRSILILYSTNTATVADSKKIKTCFIFNSSSGPMSAISVPRLYYQCYRSCYQKNLLHLELQQWANLLHLRLTRDHEVCHVHLPPDQHLSLLV